MSRKKPDILGLMKVVSVCRQVVSGDYVAYVHVIEARELKGEDSEVSRRAVVVIDLEVTHCLCLSCSPRPVCVPSCYPTLGERVPITGVVNGRAPWQMCPRNGGVFDAGDSGLPLRVGVCLGL